MSAIKKGMIPRKMVTSGTSLATPFMTYTLIPTGGVITPISDTRVMMIPNQMGSKPSFKATGKKMGTVSSMSPKESIKHPPMI